MSESPDLNAEPPAVLPVPPAGPVVEANRIDAIDAIRGFALLGIFLVNIHFFALPFGKLMKPAPPENSSVADVIAFYGVKILCEGKFYPLFSMLFGMGLILQYSRAIESGRKFVGIGLRRLLILMLFGLLHALFLWYGDILFIYASIGMVLLIFLRCKPRTLFILAGVWLILALALTTTLFSIINAGLQHHEPTVPQPTAERFADPFGRLLEAFEKGEIKEGPGDRIWVQTEMQVYREGPYDQLFLFRALSWVMVLVSCLLSFGWEVAALVFFGAGLLKAGLFTPDRAHWLRRMFFIGLFAGLPLAIAATLAHRLLPGPTGQLTGGLILILGGPLLSMGYLVGIAIIVEKGWMPTLMWAFANTGRMALTNYLSQSLIATTLFYYYGFGLFGQTTAMQRVGIVFAIYSVQLVFSSVWMRYFQFGPMEWLWRSLTYLRMQPLLRRAEIAA